MDTFEFPSFAKSRALRNPEFCSVPPALRCTAKECTADDVGCHGTARSAADGFGSLAVISMIVASDIVYKLLR